MKTAIFFVAMILALPCGAQRRPPMPHRPQIGSRQERIPRVPFRGDGAMNRITFSLPNLLVLRGYPGISVGLDYERYLTRRGNVSVDFGGRLFNAGTVRTTSIRGNKTFNEKGYALTAAAIYHPLGNRRRVDLGIGGGFLAGGLRTTVETVGYVPPPVVEDMPLNVFFAQVDMNVNSFGAFAFGVELRAGPVLNRRLAAYTYVEFGLKLGARF